jgi:hypothetical protein
MFFKTTHHYQNLTDFSRKVNLLHQLCESIEDHGVKMLRHTFQQNDYWIYHAS